MSHPDSILNFLEEKDYHKRGMPVAIEYLQKTFCSLADVLGYDGVISVSENWEIFINVHENMDKFENIVVGQDI